MLTNNIISFKQLGPDGKLIIISFFLKYSRTSLSQTRLF